MISSILDYRKKILFSPNLTQFQQVLSRSLFCQFIGTIFVNNLKMKAQNKAHGVFISKLSVILSKFKDSSTVHVGHQQLKTFFNEYSLKDIIIPFLSKMDTSQQLSDRQKKEYTKVYISLVDCFKEQILLDQYFEKIVESLNKKSVGVSQVIGFVCKGLLNRIQDLQNLYPYVKIIMQVSRNHTEIAKTMKQIIEIIDPNIISALQQDIISILHDKINNAKSKNEYLDAILSLVLNLQQKLTVLPQIHSFLVKHLKSQDWNSRKTCVDIGNALLIINHEISENIHSLIKELKYDKIKHVRESVNNYEVLYKQTYGEKVIDKPNKHYTSFRQTKGKVERDPKAVKSKSPIPISYKTPVEQTFVNASSLERSSKSKQKNASFFKNAKNSDVIKIEQNQSSLVGQSENIVTKIAENISMEMPQIKKSLQLVSEKTVNFESYLQNKNSPKMHASSPKTKEMKPKEGISGSSQVKQQRPNPKFNYENEFQSYKQKNKFAVEPESYHLDSFKEESSLYPGSAGQNSEDSSLSFNQPKTTAMHEPVLIFLKDFERKICERLDKMEGRIAGLERERHPQNQTSRMFEARVIENYQSSKQRGNTQKSLYYNESVYQSGWEESEGVESNLEQKVKTSIINENWDQAFTLALTNNNMTILLDLLERCVLPSDKTVEECILLEIKKLLGYTSALKWLKFYLTQKPLSPGRLLKLKEQLLKRSQGESKSYEMMRRIVLNQIEQSIQKGK